MLHSKNISTNGVQQKSFFLKYFYLLWVTLVMKGVSQRRTLKKIWRVFYLTWFSEHSAGRLLGSGLPYFHLNIERHWPFSDPWLVVAKAHPSPSYLNKFKKFKSKDLKEKNFVTKSITDLICFWWMIHRFPPENCDRSYDGADTSVFTSL